jgi:glycosyltransferase involved in cell wall biosynthesis
MGTALSIVLPCYNESATIVQSLTALRDWFPRDVQIVVVDDGSSDGTVDVARQFVESRGDPGIQVHARPANGGKGASIRTAIPLATGLDVLFVDADLVFGRGSIEQVLQGLAHGDVAIGNRRHAASQYAVPVRLFGFLYRRHLVGLTYTPLGRGACGRPHRDTQCGLKAFRRDALELLRGWLTIDGFAVDVEILLAARALGLRVHEVPVVVTYESAASSVRLIRSAMAMSADLLQLFVGRITGRFRPQPVRAGGATSPLPPPAPSPAPPDPPPAPSARN